MKLEADLMQELVANMRMTKEYHLWVYEKNITPADLLHPNPRIRQAAKAFFKTGQVPVGSQMVRRVK